MEYDRRRIDELGLGKRKSLFTHARNLYYNSQDGSTVMTDKAFDYLEETLKRDDPAWLKAQGTGAKVKKVKLGTKSEATLERPCASLDKVKPDDPNKLQRFRTRVAKLSSYAVLMPKLDGSSLIATYDKGKAVKLCTRGDGITGKDVTFLLPYTTLPKIIPDKLRFSVRLEALVKVDTWRKKWSEAAAGEDGFKGDRHMASAIFNRQDAHPGLADVDLLVVRAHAPDGHKEWSISEGLKCAKRNGFKVVPNKQIPTHSIEMEFLAGSLDAAIQRSPYKLDGLVLFADAPGLEATEDKPAHAIAFKVDIDDAPLTTIEKIVWQVSKHGKIVPKAQVTPVEFDGVVVSQCTLHNPKECIANGWGVGAQVRIIRSGEIIPKIVETVKKAKFHLPKAAEVGGMYEWDENETHIYLMSDAEGEGAERRKAKQFQSTLEVIGVEHAAGSIAARLVQVPYCKDQMALIKELYEGSVALFMRAGASKLMAMKIAATIPKTLTMPTLMLASGMFPEGMGLKRFNKLMELPVNWYDYDFNENTTVDLAGCQQALGKVFGQEFFDHHLKFYKRLARMRSVPIKAPAKKAKKTGKLTGQFVSWTGYRAPDEEKAVEDAGGELVSFGPKTTILLFKAGGKASSKIEKAKAKGIKVTTFDKLGV